jgi:hypothetical protein
VPESPQEKEALEKLDEATREVAWDEFDKEADREVSAGRLSGSWLGRFGRLRPFHRVKGDPEPEPVDDEDPGDEHGLRDALHVDDEKS